VKKPRKKLTGRTRSRPVGVQVRRQRSKQQVVRVSAKRGGKKKQKRVEVTGQGGKKGWWRVEEEFIVAIGGKESLSPLENQVQSIKTERGGNDKYVSRNRGCQEGRETGKELEKERGSDGKKNNKGKDNPPHALRGRSKGGPCASQGKEPEPSFIKLRKGKDYRNEAN